MTPYSDIDLGQHWCLAAPTHYLNQCWPTNSSMSISCGQFYKIPQPPVAKIISNFYTPAQRSWRGGGYTGFTLSVCPSVRPSVCRRHGFRSISQVCFGISISNFICMLMVAIGRSLLIFSDVTFRMAAWRPYWIFWFPDSNFTSALNITSNFSGTILMYMGRSLLIFSNVIFKMAAWRPY